MLDLLESQVARRHLDVRIGGLPMRFYFADDGLHAPACSRYNAYRASSSRVFPIHLRPPSERAAFPAQFSYEFERAQLFCAEDQALFSGVRHEYAFDSLLRIFLSWSLPPRAGFLLHAATVVRDGRAYVFTGHSAAGKSTVASLSPRGSVLTDEISLLSFEEGVWQAHGTPFWGEFRAAGSNTSAPIAGIFSLVQAGRHRVRPMRPAAALRTLLSNVLFFSSDSSATRRLLELLAKAADGMASYELEFQRDPGFWEVLPS